MAIARVQEAVGPDLVRIRYEIGQDWKDQWSIFFRIVLTDDAARSRLRDVAASVPVSQFPQCFGASDVAGTGVGLADELLEDEKFLRDESIAEKRQTLMRRSISTAYSSRIS
ncbi:MAG: hypothetical protein K2Q23_13455 [Bryobacteraceae bacterium]|nr:hypothetical protein [Bryobacteraceae bacterium]